MGAMGVEIWPARVIDGSGGEAYDRVRVLLGTWTDGEKMYVIDADGTILDERGVMSWQRNGQGADIVVADPEGEKFLVQLNGGCSSCGATYSQNVAQALLARA